MNVADHIIPVSSSAAGVSDSDHELTALPPRVGGAVSDTLPSSTMHDGERHRETGSEQSGEESANGVASASNSRQDPATLSPRLGGAHNNVAPFGTQQDGEHRQESGSVQNSEESANGVSSEPNTQREPTASSARPGRPDNNAAPSMKGTAQSPAVSNAAKNRAAPLARHNPSRRPAHQLSLHPIQQ
ncbi:hypothetical protein EJ06DRAFT_372148 [Trichodelitschia bisporula]|uniref:Uncharacterized protein n=1 Tax=Trichodelitschia bisporula TaxID=703511 RepID=A0A6G1I1H4_9PEZI|nr:hypothetical protein EJ06DRAFT_372148 [Trichodelitschia bisporula]